MLNRRLSGDICIRVVCTCTDLQCCIMPNFIITCALTISTHGTHYQVQHQPLHCPQKCSVLLRVPPGICSFQELPQSILSLAAVHAEVVCFPTQVHLNWFRITKGVNSPRNGLHESRVRTNSARAKSIKKKRDMVHLSSFDSPRTSQMKLKKF